MFPRPEVSAKREKAVRILFVAAVDEPFRQDPSIRLTAKHTYHY